MKAIIEFNGNQYQVEEGRYVQVDQLQAQPDEEITINDVLFIVAGEHSLLGAPFIDGALVKAKVKRHFRDKKLTVYKMRRKKGYRRKYGHRQNYTELQILDVAFPNKDKIVAVLPKPEPAPEKVLRKPAPKAEAAPKVKAKAETPKAQATVEAPKAPEVDAAPATEEKPAAKKTTKKATTKTDAGEKKPATKATAAKKPAAKKADGAAKKPAAKKTTKKEADE